ncbi:hypothetical protein GJ496_002072 [Pomphorhynchus laevis]|nr:hypothetical protein GJ496_002072 [Pomphorhynchus laevis]
MNDKCSRYRQNKTAPPNLFGFLTNHDNRLNTKLYTDEPQSNQPYPRCSMNNSQLTIEEDEVSDQDSATKDKDTSEGSIATKSTSSRNEIKRSYFVISVLFRCFIAITTGLIIYLTCFPILQKHITESNFNYKLALSLNYLPKSLAGQSRETVRNVQAAINLLQTKSEDHKVIVLLLVSTLSDNSDFPASCLAESIALAFRNSGLHVWSLDFRKTPQIVSEIDRKLNGNQVLILRNIELLNSPWILYRFCDGESPAHPNRIFILTCALGEKVSGVKGQRILEDFLRKRWLSGQANNTSPSLFGIEQIDPLFSRIANNIVFVNRVGSISSNQITIDGRKC